MSVNVKVGALAATQQGDEEQMTQVAIKHAFDSPEVLLSAPGPLTPSRRELSSIPTDIAPKHAKGSAAGGCRCCKTASGF